MKKIALFVLLLISAYSGYIKFDDGAAPAESSNANSNTTASSDKIIRDAFANKQNDLQVKGQGRVMRVLADDLKGSRHQRFILELDSGQRLLVAHNIDLAPRIPNLQQGDAVQFFGEYEWNEKGGVIHWTHKDPRGNHVAGWLKHNGLTFQ